MILDCRPYCQAVFTSDLICMIAWRIGWSVHWTAGEVSSGHTEPPAAADVHRKCDEGHQTTVLSISAHRDTISIVSPGKRRDPSPHLQEGVQARGMYAAYACIGRSDVGRNLTSQSEPAHG